MATVSPPVASRSVMLTNLNGNSEESNGDGNMYGVSVHDNMNDELTVIGLDNQKYDLRNEWKINNKTVILVFLRHFL